jgi:prepilin-type N-terminal cleavage/methylation domain-containing protein
MHAGFSLVELLVVIGIIALLVSMLMPVLRTVRENAKRVVCSTQLHQLGMAFQMYTNNNAGWLPDWSGWHVYPDGSSPYDSPGLGWTEKMAPYLSPASPIYNCPSFPGKMFNYFIEGEWAGINGRHSFKLTDVKMTSRMVLSGDFTQSALYPPPFGTSDNSSDDCDRDDFGMPCLVFPDEGGFVMHRGGNNVLFDDFHVETFRAFDASRITYHPHKMASWEQVRAEGPDQPQKQQ